MTHAFPSVSAKFSNQCVFFFIFMPYCLATVTRILQEQPHLTSTNHIPIRWCPVSMRIRMPARHGHDRTVTQRESKHKVYHFVHPLFSITGITWTVIRAMLRQEYKTSPFCSFRFRFFNKNLLEYDYASYFYWSSIRKYFQCIQYA